MREKYLNFISMEENKNKFYHARENDDLSIDVTYGRIGCLNPSIHHYSSCEKKFDELIDAKIRKGYVEKTALHVENATKNIEKPIDDTAIRAFIEDLIQRARQFVQTNYTCSYDSITPKMITEAQDKLNALYQMNNDTSKVTANTYVSATLVRDFNRLLVKVFSDVPRRMQNVKDFCAKDMADFDDILQREQDMLDNLSGQLKILRGATTGKDTVLDINHIDMEWSSYDEDDYLIEKLAKKNWEGYSNENRFIRSFKVNNSDTNSNFNSYCGKNGYSTHHGTHFYFHGTGIENMWSIFKTGLVLHPKAHITGKAFGQGLYFAEHSQKSLNYTSIQGARWNSKASEPTGWLLMYEVATGKSLCINDSSDQSRYGVNKYFTKRDLKAISNGRYDSVYAVGKDVNNKGVFKNSEIMVYDEAQCTVRYTLEINSIPFNYSLNYKERLALRFDEGVSNLVRVNDNFMAEVEYEKLSDKTKTILKKVITGHHDNFEIIYNNDKISLRDMNGNDLFNNCLTNADKRWIMRQFKRCFANNDKEFDRFIENYDGAAAKKQRKGYDR